MKFRGSAASDPSSVYPAGDYFLTCTHVQDKDKDGHPLKSKAGNDMWVLELTVAEGEHKDRKQWHYLVWLLAGTPGHGMALKALKAFGIDPEGDNEILPEHLLNVTVKAAVKIQPAEDGYDAKNVVGKWYVPGELSKPAAPEGHPGESAEVDEHETAGDFDPAKLEKQLAAVAAKPAQAAPKKKPLWGGK